MSKLAILHTTQATLTPLKELADELLPGVELMNILDDSILPQLAENGGDLEAVTPRWLQYAFCAEASGANAILCACSSVGELAEFAGPKLDVPVLRIDEPMAEKAVARAVQSGFIGVAATLETTLAPTTRLIERKAGDAGRQVQIESLLIQGAFECLRAGDQEGHDALLLSALQELAGRVEIVVLAQASMARVLPKLPEGLRGLFLTSPRSGIKRAGEIIKNQVRLQ